MGIYFYMMLLFSFIWSIGWFYLSMDEVWREEQGMNIFWIAAGWICGITVCCFLGAIWQFATPLALIGILGYFIAKLIVNHKNKPKTKKKDN